MNNESGNIELERITVPWTDEPLKYPFRESDIAIVETLYIINFGDMLLYRTGEESTPTENTDRAEHSISLIHFTCADEDAEPAAKCFAEEMEQNCGFGATVTYTESGFDVALSNVQPDFAPGTAENAMVQCMDRFMASFPRVAFDGYVCTYYENDYGECELRQTELHSDPAAPDLGFTLVDKALRENAEGIERCKAFDDRFTEDNQFDELVKEFYDVPPMGH